MTEVATVSERHDVYQEITDHIIAAIEKGVGDTEMPWHRAIGTTVPTNAFTGNSYNGVNVLSLWVAAELKGYGSGLWATYKQWRMLGGQVRKKEKASVIVFYKQATREVAHEETGAIETEQFLVGRSSWVFNSEQVDNWQPPKPDILDPAKVLENAEAFVAGTAALVRHGGERAFYSPSVDHIVMPDRDRFTGTKTCSATEGYYSVLFHELTHWTGHSTRLDRELAGRFGNDAYAMEELVAELGAAFLCSNLSITNAPRADHAAYIGNWLDVLKEDKKAIFTAASKASQAKSYLSDLQPSRKAA